LAQERTEEWPEGWTEGWPESQLGRVTMSKLTVGASPARTALHKTGCPVLHSTLRLLSRVFQGVNSGSVAAMWEHQDSPPHTAATIDGADGALQD
jgi:hypothetical protein